VKSYQRFNFQAELKLAAASVQHQSDSNSAECSVWASSRHRQYVIRHIAVGNEPTPLPAAAAAAAQRGSIAAPHWCLQTWRLQHTCATLRHLSHHSNIVGGLSFTTILVAKARLHYADLSRQLLYIYTVSQKRDLPNFDNNLGCGGKYLHDSVANSSNETENY